MAGFAGATEMQGLGEAEFTARVEEIDRMSAMYENPFLRLPLTMTEILPLGLIVALISAWIIRRKPSGI